ncbi:cellobiose phosphorylase [Gorillibacterium sp. CAU 1737]|uniref:GH36-type glycosyl hydrolase domain-containing protein n=1 Tax=Gorillibacterium sp. CAU 1737 TaxID=3140362 RepID=UPI0032601D3E
MTTLANSKTTIQAGNLAFTFWNSGDLYLAESGRTMLNQMLTNPIDGSLNNLYLRVHQASGISYHPLVGIRSGSSFTLLDRQAVWEGQAAGLEYRVVFAPTEQDVWFWDVTVKGDGATIDLVYGQDVGLADKGAVRSNEAYLSQYIDHTVFEDAEKGYVVCSRQNMPQGGAFPYLQQGSLTRSVGYSTDGFQFFGLSYKETDTPASLLQEQLANEVYQYEFAYTALQSAKVELKGEASFVFYGLVEANHPTAITSLEFGDRLAEAWKAYEAEKAFLDEKLSSATPVKKLALRPTIGQPVRTRSITEDKLEELFPAASRHQAEYADGKLAAFFTETYEHVVLKEKELRVERPHGHILMSGNNVVLGNPAITTTSYMFGVFNSHLVIGNTNFNKLMSNVRGALNVPKTSGQRIYIEQNGEYCLLTMPSLWEIGFNYVRWYYIMEQDTLVITNYAAADSTEVKLHVRSESGKAYRYLVTTQIIMDVNEYEYPIHQSEEGEEWVFRADKSALSQSQYPGLHYTMRVEGAESTLTDETILADGIAAGDASLVVVELEAAADWSMTLRGVLDGEETTTSIRTAVEEIAAYREFLSGVMNGFRLSMPNEKDDSLYKVNALAWWYTHNMLVHYSVPHGLEQYGGAAWGTRDVCQGPVEYFMATGKFEQVQDILKMVYSHQYEDDGSWPQWFMFDRYGAIQQDESHGDIIVWPLKVLADYIAITGDRSILDVEAPYTVKHSFGFTSYQASLLDHAKKELEYIRTHFLHDTHLSSYGDGDWDDTLQPANAQLKKYMVSSWTVALTYQTVTRLAEVLKDTDAALSAELHDMSSAIRADYNRYMLESSVIPGFLYLEDPQAPKKMLHPTDTETGIHYRLLPMTRSIIAELLTDEQAASHYELIQEKFLCPDGVRLMNRPAQYAGGVSTHFKRAEQASNFGREVGLQYVHAHIRYVEAMAKLGNPEDVWKGLETINPVGIQEVVPNAELRQSNAYFSSSDGKFNTRYEAQDRFDELRTGAVPVKGGWRIYSSGPGIYMNQLISAALGIRQLEGDLVLDPVLPEKLNGMEFRFALNGRETVFRYSAVGGPIRKVFINGQEASGVRLANPYRNGGLRIAREEFEKLAGQGQAVVELFA